MKKIFTFAAALMMAASAFAVTETVTSFDFLAWATAHLEEGNDGRKNMSSDQFTAGDRFVSQTFYTINEADTLPAPAFQLFPNKEWTLTRVYSSGDLQIGIRATRNNASTPNMFGFKALKKDMKVVVLSKVAATLASAESVASVASEDQEIHFAYGTNNNRVETIKVTTFTLLEDADLAIAFETGNVIYSVVVTEEVDDSGYEWQTFAEYTNGAIQSGEFTKVHTGETKDTISFTYSSKYNKNATSCTAITFTRSMTADNHYIQINIDGGFKAGDSITIQPFTSMGESDFTNNSKYANILMRTVTGEEVSNAVDLTGSTGEAKTVTDGHEEEGDPKFFGYVLTDDCDALRFGRGGNTRINLLSLSVVRKVAKVEEVTYYLTGTINNWATADENYLFAANPAVAGEYMLSVTLAEGDGIKVISSTGVWYPDGMGNEYKVDAAHAGVNTVYFRPDGQGGEGWHNGFFYLETTSAEGVENVQSAPSGQYQGTKVLENGQLIILRDGVKYNVLGAKL